MPTSPYEWNYYYQDPYPWKSQTQTPLASTPVTQTYNPNPFGSANDSSSYPTWYKNLTSNQAPSIDWAGELAKLNQAASDLKAQQLALKEKADNWQSTASAVNAANVAAQQAANNARIPNAAGLENLSSANIGSALSGQLPQDVISQLKRSAAERGVSAGLAGSQAGDAAYMRALGLNSLGLQNTGQQWLNAALNRNPGAPVTDPTAFMLTPAQESAMNLSTSQLLGNLGLQGLGLAQQGYEYDQSKGLNIAKLMSEWDLQSAALAQKERELQQQADIAQQQLGVARMNAMTPNGTSGGGYRGTSSGGVDWSSLFGNNSGFNYNQQSGGTSNPNATAITGNNLPGDPYANTIYNPNTNTSDYWSSGAYSPVDWFSGSGYSAPLYSPYSGFNYSPAPLYDIGAGFNYSP